MNQMNFDPQTGEPIVHQNAPAQQPAPEAPVYQQPAPAPKKKGKGGKIAAGIIAAAVVVGGAIFGVHALKSVSPLVAIQKAGENTFVDDAFTEQIKKTNEMVADGAYAVEAAVEASGEKVDFNFNSDSGDISLDGSYNDLSAVVYMDDSKITLDIPKADIDTLCYDYTTDKSDSDSYIVQMAGADNLKQVDSIIQMIHSMMATKIDKEAVQKVVTNHLKELEFEKLDKKSIDLGGDKVECGGYETTLTGEFVHNLLNDVYKEMYGKTMDDFLDELSSMGLDNGSVDTVKNKIDDMEEVDLKFYINDKKFAMIDVETTVDGQDIDAEVSFAGEDIPWHEMTVRDAENDQTVELSVDDDNGDLTYNIKGADGQEAAFTYDADSGDFKVSSDGSEAMSGKFTVDGSEADFSIDELNGSDTDVDLAVKNDAKVEEAPEGKDILKMNAMDFSSIAQKLYQLYYSIG